MRVQNNKNRSFLDITSLRNRQPPCHTESHHFVTQSHDCLKIQGFYSSVQRKTGKKTRSQCPSKMATVFVQSFMIFHSVSLEVFAYHRGHFLQEIDKRAAFEKTI